MRRAAITGMGVVCGGADDVGAFARLLFSGGTAVREVAALGQHGLSLGPLALVPEALGREDEALFSGAERTTPLCLRAAAEAWMDAGLGAGGGGGPGEGDGVGAGEGAVGGAGGGAGGLLSARIGVCFGTTLGSKGPWLRAVRGLAPLPGSPADPEDWSCAGPTRAVAAWAGAGVTHTVSTACASGNAALGQALALIRSGRCDVVLAGGADSLQDFVLAGFGALRAHDKAPCRPFDRSRRGLNLGEGAGFVVLEDEAHARRRGARVRAYLDGSGLSADAHHMTGPDRAGLGAARAIRAALQDADATSVDFVSLHGTATVFNDLMEAQALRAVFGAAAAEVPVNSIKGAIGHTLGASGLLEAIMVVLALEEGRIPPTAGHEERDPEIPLRVVAGAPLLWQMDTVLSTSSGFGGLNAAVVLRRGA